MQTKERLHEFIRRKVGSGEISPTNATDLHKRVDGLSDEQVISELLCSEVFSGFPEIKPRLSG